MSYYKVLLENDDEKYYSCWISDKNRVEYKLDKWVQAKKENREKGYHLLVFNDRKSAIRFIRNINMPICYLVLFKCLIENVIGEIPNQKPCGDGKIKFDTCLNIEWPDDIVMVERVKIYGKPIDIYEDINGY